MDWYRDWFSEQYLALYRHRDHREAAAQIDLISSILHLGPESRILDIACGSGRHLREFQKRRLSAVGIDLSSALLSRASKETSSVNNNSLIRADMRALPFAAAKFNLLTSFFTSFGYFETDKEHLGLLKEWRRVLCKDGHLVLDYLNRDFVINNIKPESRLEQDGRTILQRRSLSADGTRINKDILITEHHANKTSRFLESVRMYSLGELTELLETARFSPKHCFGGYNGAAFLPSSSERLILMAKATGNL